jgi:DNA-binding MarR family transcriptional regulator
MAKRIVRPRPPGMRDHVDHLVEGWSRERPDLDTSAVTVVYRLTRIAAVWNGEIEKVFASAGITGTDFAVMANLRRAGAPYRLPQRQLMTVLRLTSGTVSLRIDKMVERGLVTRTHDPGDARAAIVELTEAGRQLFDEVAPLHLANEARLLAALPPDRRAELADLLRAILVDIEQPEAERPDRALGLHVSPATVGQRKRAELGLRPQHGLLVESVVPGGPAATAGIRPGDLLTHAGETPLHSLTCLERAREATPGDLTLRALRSERPLRFRIGVAG